MNNKEKHGKCGTRIYRIWKGMRGRCLYENNRDYPNYGGRGISLCDEWTISFQAFYSWAISNGYKDNLTIDRENNNLGYFPDNCRWVTIVEQNRNRRNAVNITLSDGVFPVAELSGRTGLKPATIYRRIKKGDKNIIRPVEDPHESLIGRRFGKLTVIKFSHTDPDSYWLCKCDCGSYKVVNGARMLKGSTKSCGCIRGLSYNSAIDQINLHGETVNAFSSVDIASKETGIERRYISACVRGKSKTARGFIWRYNKEVTI